MGPKSTATVQGHRAVLRHLDDWKPYLAAHSRLPGPRANLELVAACGEEADAARAHELLESDDEFAVMCGLVALGRLLGEGDEHPAAVLRSYASDPRWRVREAVAIAVQRAGDDDPARAFGLAEAWASDPDPLARRAAVVAVCEPRLLREANAARRALGLLTRVTVDLAGWSPQRHRTAAARTLRQALGYGWSVVVAALPQEGLPAFHRLEAESNPDVAWIVRENRKKARLRRLLDPQGPLPAPRRGTTGQPPGESVPAIMSDIDAEQAAWTALLARLSDAQLRHRVYGAWTPVDTLAHVTAWKANALEIARRQAHPDAPDPGPTHGPAGVLHIDVDGFNAHVLEGHRDWPVARVVAWSQDVHRQLVAALADLPTERLLNGRGRHGARPWYWMPAVQHSGGHRRALERLLAETEVPSTQPGT